MVATACGGGDSTEQPDDSVAAQEEDSSTAGDSAGDQATESGDGSVGPVSATAEPGQAWVEVDGERFVYEASGSLGFTCDVQEDFFSVNFQTSEGQDLLINGTNQGSGWVGNMTFKSADAGNIQYSASMFSDGSVGLGDGALSYEGIVERIEDFDFETATDLNAVVAVNCAPAGDAPTATFGDLVVSAPLSGAQSVECSVSDPDVTVMINRLALEGVQISVDSRVEGETWVGSVSVINGDDRYSSTLPPDGEGLEIDGSAVNYAGAFIRTSNVDPDLEEEVEGTVAVTCP